MQNREDTKEKSKNTQKTLFERLRERLPMAGEHDERVVRARLSALVRFLLTVAAAYLAGSAELFFGTYPGAPALMLSDRKRLPALSLGLGLALLSGRLPLIYGFLCPAVLLIRILAVLLPAVYKGLWQEKGEEVALIPFREDALELPQEPAEESSSSEEESAFRRIFCEDTASSLLCGALGGLLCGLMVLIDRSFSMYGLFATLFSLVAVPGLSLVFWGAYGRQEWLRVPYAGLSMGALGVLSVLAAERMTVLGLPLAPCLALLLTLWVTAEYGILCGLGGGAVFGLALDPLYLGLLMLSALLLGLLYRVKKSVGVAVVCGAVVVWCYYLGGEAGLLGVLPPMLLALPLYMAADRYTEMMRAPYRRPEAVEGLYFAEAVVEQTKNEAAKDRLASLSEAFESLSENFYKLSNRFQRPDLLGIKEITDAAFEETCRSCPNLEVCRGAGYECMIEAMGAVNGGLHRRGSLREEELPEGFRMSCLRCRELTEAVNRAAGAATASMIKAGKADFFASNYDDITAILDAALDADPEEYACDPEAGGKVFDYLYSLGLNMSGVAVYGKRCRRVVVRRLSGQEQLDGERSAAIGSAISRILGEPLTEPVLEVGRDGTTMLLYSRPQVMAYCAHGSLVGAEGEAAREKPEVDPFAEEVLCGDKTEAFVTNSSYFYALISDGMGSGADAAYTAEVSAMFIEKMLSAGNRADVTLRMLNNVIRSENLGCGNECSATVDLLELDLMNGKASFIKSGAAPTYVAREGTVYKISARTMPVGIIKDADARITKFDTRKGDIIVMISDGCCPDNEDCPWLVEYLCNLMSRGRLASRSGEGEQLCQQMKEEILALAKEHFPKDRERDDISVNVIEIGARA